MQGVTLFSKERGRHSDAFELALTYNGIEIRRPGESARHLSWERISEWEIEQRRGGVLLTLRGGGAVTPLVIPRWKVDELDLVLRDVTSHATDIALYPEAEPDAPAPVVTAAAPAAAMPAPPLPGDYAVTAPPFLAARVPEVAFVPEPEPEVAPEPEPVVAVEPEPEVAPEAEPEPVVAVEPEPEVAAQPEPEPLSEVEPLEPEPRVDEVMAHAVAPSGVEPTEAEKHESEEVAVSLIWPEDTPLKDFADLSWPVQSGDGERGAPTDIDVVLDPLPPSLPPVFAGQVDADDADAPTWAEWDNPPGPSDVRSQVVPPPTTVPPARPPAVRIITPEPEPEAPAPVAERPRVAPPAPSATPEAPGSSPLLIHPVEGASLSPPRPPVAAPRAASVATPEATPRALRRRRARRKVPAKAVATVALLALLATAVILVLAQSAGAIHLGFLGTPG
jgi:hypothetical protein